MGARGRLLGVAEFCSCHGERERRGGKGVRRRRRTGWGEQGRPPKWRVEGAGLLSCSLGVLRVCGSEGGRRKKEGRKRKKEKGKRKRRKEERETEGEGGIRGEGRERMLRLRQETTHAEQGK